MSQTNERYPIVLMCPYCGDGPKHIDSLGCCHESSAHFTQGIMIEEGHCISLEELEDKLNKNREDKENENF